MRYGAVLLEDIVAVHSALKIDPTHKSGNLATSAFRNSKDQYNAALSFSIITHHNMLPGQVETLDI